MVSTCLLLSDEDNRGGSVDQDIRQTLPEALFLQRWDPHRDLPHRVAHVLKLRGKFDRTFYTWDLTWDLFPALAKLSRCFSFSFLLSHPHSSSLPALFWFLFISPLECLVFCSPFLLWFLNLSNLLLLVFPCLFIYLFILSFHLLLLAALFLFSTAFMLSRRRKLTVFFLQHYHFGCISDTVPQMLSLFL